VTDRDRPASVVNQHVAVTLTPQKWMTTAGTAHDSHTQALQAARPLGAVPLAAADAARPVSLPGV